MLKPWSFILVFALLLETKKTYSQNTNTLSTTEQASTASTLSAIISTNATQALALEATTEEGSSQGTDQPMETSMSGNGAANQTLGMSTTETITEELGNISSTSLLFSTTPLLSVSTTEESTVEDSTAQSSTQSSTTRGSTTQPPASTTPEVATTTAAGSSSDTILAVVLSCFFVILLIFLIVLYFYCKQKGNPCRKLSDRENVTLRLTPAEKNGNRRSLIGKHKFERDKMMVSTDHFEKEYLKKSSDDNRLFRMEYLAVHQDAGDTHESTKLENQAKNRYDNILAFDSTRVVLTSTQNGYGDYINANYVSGYKIDKQWIATQGPKEDTLEDFWKMVWEQRSRTIIMITNLTEQSRVKCHKYWPDHEDCENGSQSYGEYNVTLLEEKQRNFYVLRVFTLHKDSEPERTVKQFHYTSWPDFGVPGNASQLLQFRRRIISANPPDAGPIVIHCSAGVGRTGTFIVIDAAIRQVDVEGGADIFTFLSNIREQRMKLIQTDAQYAFCHKAVVEYIKYGNTEMAPDEFVEKISKIKEEHDRGDETILEDEFQSLLKIPLLKDNMQHGKANLKKNRLLQIVPYDFNRVVLPRKPGQEKSEYINASYIDGCYKKSAFIATQGPLEETVLNFWTMIWGNGVKTISMIVKLKEKGLSTCSQYWPESENEPKTYGDITVVLTEQEHFPEKNYTVRQFNVSHVQFPDRPRPLKQFHFLGWPDIGGRSPENSDNFMNFITAVLRNSEDHLSPIVVHCSSGGGRTGVFCCLATLLGKLEGENLVDVIQTVRHLREQRPHLIQTQEQYNFCYFAFLSHLKSKQSPLSLISRSDEEQQEDSTEDEEEEQDDEEDEEEEEEQDDEDQEEEEDEDDKKDENQSFVASEKDDSGTESETEP